MKKKICLNSLVKIIYGKDKNKISKVIKILNENYVLVKNIKIVKKHKKDNFNKINNIKNIESKIHISNLLLIKK